MLFLSAHFDIILPKFKSFSGRNTPYVIFIGQNIIITQNLRNIEHINSSIPDYKYALTKNFLPSINTYSYKIQLWQYKCIATVKSHIFYLWCSFISLIIFNFNPAISYKFLPILLFLLPVHHCKHLLSFSRSSFCPK